MTMKNKNIKVYAFLIILTLAGGMLAGFLNSNGINEFNTSVIKPPFTPPPIAFPIAWTILYIMMAVGAARVKILDGEIFVYYMQLAFNYFWVFIFFGAGAYMLSFIWIIVLIIFILIMAVSFYRVDAAAGLLQAPYLMWTLFAAYLNFGTYLLNR